MIEASMEDQQPPEDKAAMVEVKQPPGEEAAMVEGQQKKPDEAVAMVEDQQQQLELEKAAMARYPAAEVAKTVAFLNEMTASLEADGGVRDGLLGLLAGFGQGGGGGTRAVVRSRVADLLAGHPDVLARFTAFINRAKAAAPAVAPGGPLAVTRPRRSSTRNKNGTDAGRCRTLPAVKEEPDAQDLGSPPPNKGGAGGRKRGDSRIAEAEAFLKRVLETAGREVWDKLVAALNLHAAGDQFADVVYGDVKEALGPAHAALLCEFAGTFLPGQKEWDEQARREAQRKRRRDRAAARRAADDHKPPRAADDDGNHRKLGVRVGGESSGGGGGGTATTLVVVKKRRADGGDQRGHDDDNYAPRDRTKKPRTDNGHRRHAVGSNGEPSCSGVAARVLDAGVHGHGDKKPRRRAANGGKGTSAAAAAAAGEEQSNKDRDALYRGFRKLWVFYTRYSILVETMARVRKLLCGGGGGGGFPASVEELFPHREHRELLGGYYGDRWGQVMAALEGGDSTGPALEAVLRTLKAREVEAVAAEARARRRNDAERAVERLAGLVADGAPRGAAPAAGRR